LRTSRLPAGPRGRAVATSRPDSCGSTPSTPLLSARATRVRGPRAALVVAIGVLALAGAACRQDMHDQPSYSAFEESAFFPDGSSARQPVEGTVARGHLRDDQLLYSGLDNGEPATVFPFPIDEAVMARGRDMFNAYCAPCHGQTGGGDGIVVQRGFTRPPDLAEPFVRSATEGYLFGVISNGIGVMPDHAAQIAVRDRWAIVAYLRALQRSASAVVDDVPPAERSRLEPR
jgi:mono/diheme cytochrome c family protein